ncbi:hypothetical protein DWZ43_10325 [Ruminococcus sp. AF32-2AC]|jgi:hypothetical protein|nr:hypothetical protein DWZ43_10325 [Ruminococcus sp. AF32-2AC]
MAEKKKEKVTLPFNFRVNQCRNYIRLAINTATSEYGLDGAVISLIIESLLEDEYREQVAFMAEQTDAIVNQIQNKDKEN